MKVNLCQLIQNHLNNCEECKLEIRKQFAFNAGSTKSNKKSEAARINGKLGGRPKKNG